MPDDHQNFPTASPLNYTTYNGENSPFGLYIHIPFCRSKCNYCAFVSAPPNNDDEMNRYTEAICQHLRMAAPIGETRKLSTVYIGGGTPSLLGPNRLSQIFDVISEVFLIRNDAEITIEANPESATLDLFQRLIPKGLNRISMGAQSFRDDELKRLGRIHSSEEINRAIEKAREAGLSNISLDLIFALPAQTTEDWIETLEKAMQNKPQHISAYGLTYEEGTLLERLSSEGKITPVLDETYITMYDKTCRFFTDHGLFQYEISNWSAPGMESKHNQLYWRREEYLAVGVSAHGAIGDARYSLIKNKTAYTDILLDKNIKDTDFFHPDLMEERVKLTVDEMASDVMIFGLRQTEGIFLQQFLQSVWILSIRSMGARNRTACRTWINGTN